MTDAKAKTKKITVDFKALVDNSKKFRRLKRDCQVAVKLSLTGITNLVTNYEDPALVNEFLEACYKKSELYKESLDIDAVELQGGAPGGGSSRDYIDKLIYGNFERVKGPNGEEGPIKTDPRTGKRLRLPDGFINRIEVLTGEAKDKVIVIRNLDYCIDFCSQKPGQIDPQSMWIFDLFRDSMIKKVCRILLVTNEKLEFPFQTRTVKFEPVDILEAKHVVAATEKLFATYKIQTTFSNDQRKQIYRKLCGLTYTVAGDAFMEAMSRSRSVDATGSYGHDLDSVKVTKQLSEKINRNLMERATGLTHLTPKPWEDYICPESSSFTFDVRKIIRDFDEIKTLRVNQSAIVQANKNDDHVAKVIESIRSRMPHVIVLYGKGGVGKCLGKGTKVMMSDGSGRSVEDVRIGDRLMGANSKPRKVLSTTSGTAPLFKVSQKNGDDYVCNGDHVLSLQKESSVPGSKPVFISVNDYMETHKTWKKTHYGWKVGVEFKERELPIDPYWLGVWLGDGTSLKPAITIGDGNEELKEWLEVWAKENNLFIRKEIGRGAEVWNFSPRKGSGWCRNKVKTSLKDINVFGNKHIPEIYLKNSRKNRLELLAGLIDSDGHRTQSGCLEFANTNKRLAEDTLALVRSLGFKGFWRQSIKRLKSRNYEVMSYTVTAGGALSKIPTKLARKKGHDNPQKRSSKCGISIDPIGDGEYFGFTIDGDHQFLLEDFTVTHNSAFPIHFAGLLDFDVWDFNVNASHSMWVGEGPKRMREALDQILRSSHLVVRIDEYDRAIGSTTAAGQGMHEAHKQVESEFMNWLQNSQEDNLLVKQDIFIVLTTNHKENITGPLLRTGRADLVIDIGDFDAKSMKETFLSAHRRMKSRDVVIVGYGDDYDLLAKDIESLDLNKLAEVATRRSFTVRDVDVLLQEMAAHAYYLKKGKEGLPWNTDVFVDVLENSRGSGASDNTSELVLGDRFVLCQDEDEEVEEKTDIPTDDSTEELDKLKSKPFFQ